MKALTLILTTSILPATLAQAAPHTIADRLAGLIPEGYSEGVTEKNAPCRVIFHRTSGTDYARAQVMAEPEGHLVDVEIFFNGDKGKATGRWGRALASVKYREVALSAQKTKGGILVKAERSFGSRKVQTSCLLSQDSRADIASDLNKARN